MNQTLLRAASVSANRDFARFCLAIAPLPEGAWVDERKLAAHLGMPFHVVAFFCETLASLGVIEVEPCSH